MPVTTSYPGVYIQELPSGVRTITGVSTSVTAFVGQTATGPKNKAVRVLSISDYELNFGDVGDPAQVGYLGYAVRQFFLNGGSQAYVVRLPSSKNAPKASFNVPKSGGVPALTVTALSGGSDGNGSTVQVSYPEDSADAFNLTIGSIEMFKDLSMDSSKDNFVEKVVNDSGNGSKLVHVAVAPGVTERPLEGPAHANLESSDINADLSSLPSDEQNSFRIKLYDKDTFNTVPLDSKPAGDINKLASLIQEAVRALKPQNAAYQNFTCAADGKKLKLTSGAAGATSTVEVMAAANNSIANELQLLDGSQLFKAKDWVLTGGKDTVLASHEVFNLFIGDQLKHEGIYALELIDIFNLLCLPSVTDSQVMQYANAFCQEHRAFLIVDPPQGLTPNQMTTYVSSSNPVNVPPSDHAAIYYPWIKSTDSKGNVASFPPSGTIAGLYARIDSTRGVWKAPAGTEAQLGALALDLVLTDSENGILLLPANPISVNCLRAFAGYGIVSWGARTLAPESDSDYRYVPVRRLALYIEESLFRGTKWVVFEPNDEPLWAQIRLNVGAFMQDLFRKGAFQGSTPKEAYFVKCDKETTTQNDINLGIVNIVVGFAPLKPAEFVIIKIQQIAGQIAV